VSLIYSLAAQGREAGGHMAISQRLSRGFHRLALFSAVIPLLVGGYLSAVYAVGEASMPPEEVWSRPALKIEGFGTVPLPPGFDRLTRDERDELVDQMAASLRPQSRRIGRPQSSGD
jgi:hypothetical protein